MNHVPNESIHYRPLIIDDLENLEAYLKALSTESKNRFGPHGYDLNSLRHIHNPNGPFKGFIAENFARNFPIAYAIVKTGYLDHERDRLQGYGWELRDATDCTFAPSVSDKWQGKGIGRSLFEHVLTNLKKEGYERMVLWGGVQISNQRALKFYKKLGFMELGTFEYAGTNIDMALTFK
jgi:GNAT superfamily N-acetyltransferase